MKDIILLDHGSGGKASHRLIETRLLPRLDNPMLRVLDDGAVFDSPGPRLAMTTDSYVVSPLFFPGGDIGKLAVCGTVNDLAMCGAVSGHLSLSLVIEEGFPLADLDRVLASIAETAQEAGVMVVTGDTKVVPRGAADRLFINTAGVGPVREGANLSARFVKPGDCVILSGNMGDHGAAIMALRNGLNFADEIKSDAAPLNGLAEAIMATGADVHCLRDPTRGGVGTTLCVAGACDITGLEPLYLANEGKLLCFVAQADAQKALEAMKGHPYGKNAVIIGCVEENQEPMVYMKTIAGGTRVVDMLAGEQLPRIC
ncbi:MAG: hydrogenase expression/formation protein HypE [Deltaproteobacteria bacterium]|nr:hydrogenase expression/formation protein HypE [Deltaproteobacteria bacterium]